MKKLIFLFLILIPSIALAETIQLEWDYENDQNIDGFKLYQKKKIQEAYDYTSPVLTIDANQRSAEVYVPVVADKVQGYNFVLRAFNSDYESGDSNQVEYFVVGIVPLAPINLTGEYNKLTSILNLSWEQPTDEYEIWQWIVYYKINAEDQFVELGRVDKGQALTLTKDFNDVAEGDSRTVYFTVVSFRRDYSVHSENSAEFSLVIDRTGPPIPPENLKINIEIPVQ